MFTRNNKRFRKGSLLIEALLSVVVLSVGITMIIQAMTSSLRAATYSTEYTKALILLENKMFELIQKGIIQTGKNEKESFPAPYEKYESNLITKKASAENASELNEVLLEILWRSGRKNNRIQLTTYLFDEE